MEHDVYAIDGRLRCRDCPLDLEQPTDWPDYANNRMGTWW